MVCADFIHDLCFSKAVLAQVQRAAEAFLVECFARANKVRCAELARTHPDGLTVSEMVRESALTAVQPTSMAQSIMEDIDNPQTASRVFRVITLIWRRLVLFCNQYVSASQQRALLPLALVLSLSRYCWSLAAAHTHIMRTDV